VYCDLGVFCLRNLVKININYYYNIVKSVLKKLPLVGVGVTAIGRVYESRKEAWFGPHHVRHQHQIDTKIKATIGSGLDIIGNRWLSDEINDDAQPIFILSAGWRSGSTLLQRLIMSDKSVLIWGEPYGHANLIQGLSESLTAFTNTWPQDDYFVEKFDTELLGSTWVANMYPSIKNFQQAHTVFFERLFAKPARDLGFERWGLKEVRLTIEHARYLRWLYPNARFLFLLRDPKNAYRSYRVCRDFYLKWPNQPIMTPKLFAKHWRDLAVGYLEGYHEIGGMLLKYEDLCAGRVDVGVLEEYLELPINPSVLSVSIGTKKAQQGKRQLPEVPKYELKIIEKVVRSVAIRAGY